MEMFEFKIVRSAYRLLRSPSLKMHFSPAVRPLNREWSPQEIAPTHLFSLFPVSKLILFRPYRSQRPRGGGDFRLVQSCFSARQHSGYPARRRRFRPGVDQPGFGEEIDRANVVSRVEFRELLQAFGRNPRRAVVGHLKAIHGQRRHEGLRRLVRLPADRLISLHP